MVLHCLAPRVVRAVDALDFLLVLTTLPSIRVFLAISTVAFVTSVHFLSALATTLALAFPLAAPASALGPICAATVDWDLAVEAAHARVLGRLAKQHLDA